MSECLPCLKTVLRKVMRDIKMHFATSDKKKPCVAVLIGNDDEEEDEEVDEEEDEEEDDGDDGREGKVTLACACAQRLYDVLNYTKKFSGHPQPILLLDKSEEEIREGIEKAVQLVKKNGASWLAIYYAGHSFYDDLNKEIVIEPKTDGAGICLEEQVKLALHNAELGKIRTIIFMDSCLKKKKVKEVKDDQLNNLGNTFLLVKSCEFDEGVRDGRLFARALERCARKNLKQRELKEHVEELACQLSFGRLCPGSCFEELENEDDMVLTEEQRELFKKTHFLRFALDLWTAQKLERDTQIEDSLEPGDSVIDKIVEILREIAKKFETMTRQAAFEKPWSELEAIAHCESLEDFLEYLKKEELETLDRDVRTRVLIPENVLIAENVRGAIVEVLQEKIKKIQLRDLGFLGYLVENIGMWYKEFEGTKCSIPSEPGTLTCTYSLVVKDLDVTKLPESKMKLVARQINESCKYFGIRGRIYLVPGSLWIIFCLNAELSRDCRRNFAASLKSWINQQKQSGANGWTLAQDPCWKPLYAVPDRILDLVRQVESLCGSCLPTNPTECMWLRASDLRNLVARERKLEEWRVVVFEGLMERRGDSWLQGTGTLGCCLLEHFEDERLDHRMQEVANLACMRKQSMRPEVQVLVFLLQLAQLELTDEEWTQVVDSARVCYEHLKTVLRKVMLDKDTDLIVVNDIVDSGTQARSDMPPCVVVLIGNNDVKEDEEEDEEEDGEEDRDEDGREEKVKVAGACAQRLYDVLNHTRMFSGHQVCGDPILLLDKSKEEIMEGIQKAVQLVKDHDASWLAIYYAGPSFLDIDTEEIVIKPKADGREMRLEKQVKLTVHNGQFDENPITTIFVDGCLELDEAEDEAEDDYQLQDSQNFLKDEDFPLVRSCRYGFKVRDGCLFARAIERCARESFDTLDVLIQYVQEFAWQLSCGRLCPWSKCPEKTKFLVLSQTERRKGLLEQFHFLPFALDLWTEDQLELDPQTVDRLDPEGSDID